MRKLRALRKLAQAVGHALGGYWTIRRKFASLDAKGRAAEVEHWARGLLEILGVELRVHGTSPREGPLLLVANHISWLDIVALHAAAHCRFVSKAQVRHWPLVGALATAGGTLYVERESRRDAMRVVHTMAERLAAGDIIAVFPEGTTTDGSSILPFHANLLQAAISAQVQIEPVAIRFEDAQSGEESYAASYIGDETLVGSLWRLLASRPIRAVIWYGIPEFANGRGRRQWASDLHAKVQALRPASKNADDVQDDEQNQRYAGKPK